MLIFNEVCLIHISSYYLKQTRIETFGKKLVSKEIGLSFSVFLVMKFIQGTADMMS